MPVLPGAAVVVLACTEHKEAIPLGGGNGGKELTMSSFNLNVI